MRWFGWGVLCGLAACGGDATTDVVDADGDGVVATEDCDDADDTAYPGAPEVCDGRDNDCDGFVDDDDLQVDVSTGQVFYADVDGDGFGDAKATVRACAAPDGFVDASTDCDDASDRTFPGAPEVCDGRDNDCDPSTPEAGAAFVDADGELTDWTATLGAGTETTPVVETLPEPGTLYVCAGTWYAGLQIDADVDVIGPDGSEVTVLDGAGAVHGIWIDEAVTSWLQGLTLTGFVDGVGDEVTGAAWGAALRCEGAATVTGTDLAFVDNEATGGFGGAVAVRQGCALSLSTSSFDGGSANLGGQMAVAEASATLTGVSFSSGAAFGAGALLVGSPYLNTSGAPTSVSCDDCTFTGNTTSGAAPVGGGAVWVANLASFSMVGGSMTGNTAGGSGGAVLVDNQFGLAGASASFDETTFDENLQLTPKSLINDVAVPDGDGFYEYAGTAVTVSCVEGVGCQ
ncbi:MAG: putative metal-binding motif-containing protein [Myxococcales bacterium]|nr:putative metal-binding motif-containing protein [Myxococcales bacterium]